MADVSVEFGATDTGLQKTLETIQQQMTSLQGEVDSGTLSFQEINQKMRELKQAEGIFTKLGGEMSESAKSAKEFQDQMRAAEAVTKANRTALDIYSEEVDKLTKLLDSGLISQKTYASAIEKAEAALKAATPQTDEAKRANEELEASLKKAEAETRALADEQRKAEAITKSNRSATEIYNQEVEELQKHLSGGRISMETFEKAVAKADAKLAAANPQVEELGKDIAETGNKSDKMGDQAGIGFGKLAAAVGVGQIAAKAFTAVLDAGFAAVRGTIQGFTDALNLGGTLSDLSASSGESAGNLLLLQRAFDNTGAGAEKVGPVLSKLSAAINNTDEDSKKAALGFGRMGISLSELQGKSATDQLNLVSQGLQSIKDPGERAAAAVAVFGKSGAELLPLLNNFSGEMDEARATVGSLADIMDRRANVFDAVGDRFLIIQQKVRDFAAGILDRALPAIDAITSALSRIDAAAIGQKLADAFLGGEGAMKGFQAAVDAISLGKIGLAFEVFWESLKLQAMQSGNSIYKFLMASLQTTADAIVGLFGPSSGTFTLLIDSFAYAGKAAGVKFAQGILGLLPDINDGLLKTINIAATFVPNIAGPAALAFNAANKGLDALRGSMDGMQANLEKQKETLGTSFANFSANAKKQIGEIPEEFETNLANANAEFYKTGEQAAVVKKLQDEVTAATAATAAEHANANQTLALTGTLTEQLSTVEAALTEAIASGNTQLAEQLNQQKGILEKKLEAKALEDQAKADKTKLVELETQLNLAKAAGNTELAASLEKQLQQQKATEEIAKLTTEYQKTLGVTKTEAGILAENFVLAKNAAGAVKVDTTTVSAAKAEAGKAAEAAKSFATWLDYIKGVDPSQGVKSTREQAAEARKEIEAFGEYVGMNLSRMSYPDIAKKLGIDTMGMTGKEQMNAILEHIASKRGELTGIQPIDEKGGKTALDGIQTKLKDLGSTPQTLNLDASASIEKIKGEFKKNIDLAVSTGEGSKILGEIKGFVETIKGLVEKIEPKLPTHALA